MKSGTELHTTSAPSTISGLTLSLIKVDMSELKSGSSEWDQSSLIYWTLGCEEERSNDLTWIEKHKISVKYSLQGRFKLSRHLWSTSSLISVRYKEPDFGNSSIVWFKRCKMAVTIPRKPMPEPSSRTRVEVTISVRKKYSIVQTGNLKTIYLDEEWDTESTRSLRTRSAVQWYRFLWSSEIQTG